MIVALRAMDPDELETAPVVPREKGALRAALRYVRATPGAARAAADDGAGRACSASTSS